MEWGRSMPEFDLATVIFYVGIITKNLWVEFLRKIIWKFVWVVLFGVFFLPLGLHAITLHFVNKYYINS